MQFGEKKDIYIVLKYCPTRYCLTSNFTVKKPQTTTAKVMKAAYGQQQNKPTSCISQALQWTQYHLN